MSETYKQQVLLELEKQYEAGKTIWQQDFPAGELQRTVPCNPVTGMYFAGIAETLLRNKALERGYQDPRWVTSYQAYKNGWKLKAGAEKGCVKVGAAYTDPATGRTVYKYHHLYNAAEVEGMPPPRRTRVPNSRRLAAVTDRKARQIQQFCTSGSNDLPAAIAKTMLATESGAPSWNSRNRIGKEQLRDFFTCYPRAMAMKEELLARRVRERRAAGMGY